MNPSIPFIGRNYRPGRGLLVYASAENLTWLNHNPTPERFTTEAFWNRYRVRYEKTGRNSGAFFPDVSIQPVTDGGLFAAALFVSKRLRLPTAAKPRTLLEKIAVSNWCKFTIKADLNVDCISNLGKLAESLPFAVGELVELQSAIVLLPQQVWRKSVLRAVMHGASPCTRFMPVYQFNTTVVETRLGDYAKPARRLRKQEAGTPLAKWMANLNGFYKTNAWRYIAYLEETLGAASAGRSARP